MASLIKEIINKKLGWYADLQNSRNYLIAAWNLHIVYLICASLTNQKINDKNKLFSRFFSKINNNEFNDAQNILNKINNLAHEEINVINLALEEIELKNDLAQELGDINPEKYRNYGFVAVSSWNNS